MAKRFTDTEKWTKNKWFRKLPNDLKLFWLFILDNCDCVGVWEEDVEFVCDLLNMDLTKEKALTAFSSQIQIIQDGKKWWIKNFCFYQYGELKEENIKNKPHQKYVSELKKHRLWIDYTKTIHSLQEEEEEKEEDKDKERKGGVGEKPKPEFETESDVFESLLTAEDWHNTLMIGHKIEKPLIPVLLNAFKNHRKLKLQAFTGRRDYVSHFDNWLRKIDLNEYRQQLYKKQSKAIIYPK